MTRRPHQLDATRGELVLSPGKRAKFRGTDWRIIGGVREQYGPVLAQPLMKAKRAFGGFDREIGSYLP